MRWESLQGFAPMSGLHDTHTSRSNRREDLSGHVHVDQIRILETKFGTDRISSSFAKECTAYLRTHLTKDLDTLERLVSVQPADLGRLPMPAGQTKLESHMYQPLLNICHAIENFQASDDKSCPLRSFVIFGSKHPKQEGTYHLPKYAPDLAPIDKDPGSLDPNSILSRQMASFLEIKLKADDSPAPREQEPKITTVQCSDYARLIFATRPFQVFVLGMHVFGDKFSVSYYDHAGIAFSPEFDFFQELELFVRIIRRVTCHMSIEAFGLDPGVKLHGTDTIHQRKPFPSFRVALTADGSVSYRTHGPPIWSSVSLLGRATSVWTVSYLNAHPVTGVSEGLERFIMKCTWRKPTRQSESVIYRQIPSGTHGVASFVFGDDAPYPHWRGQWTKIDISSLRHGLPQPKADENTILHRVVIEPHGKALWHYDTPSEFLLAVVSALTGHRELVARHILHRDISIGNVFICVDQMPFEDVKIQLEQGAELPFYEAGFLADVELASLTWRLEQVEGEDPSDDTTPIHPLETVSGRTRWFPHSGVGPQMTGTVPFIATEIIDDVIDKKGPRRREVHHDLESFCWVILYAIYKHYYEAQLPLDKDVKEEFRKVFSGSSLMDLRTQRQGYVNRPNMPSLFRLLGQRAPELRRVCHGVYRLLKAQLTITATTFEDDVQFPEPLQELGRQNITYANLFAALESGLRSPLTPSRTVKGGGV